MVCLDSAWLSLRSSDPPHLMGLGIGSCTSGQRSPFVPRPPLTPPSSSFLLIPTTQLQLVCCPPVRSHLLLPSGQHTVSLGQLGSKRALLLLLLSLGPRGQARVLAQGRPGNCIEKVPSHLGVWEIRNGVQYFCILSKNGGIYLHSQAHVLPGRQVATAEWELVDADTASQTPQLCPF